MRTLDPRYLVRAVFRGDDLAARQFVKDAKRASYPWHEAPPLDFKTPRERALYASLVELFSERSGKLAPEWTKSVGPASRPVFLMRCARESAAMRRGSLETTPDVLRKRKLFAWRDYLDVL